MATITTAGAVPANPTDLLNAELAAAIALSPGLTANLPGSLVEDMASTAVGALVVQDQAYVDLVNSIAPTTANAFLLYQLGQTYGVQQGLGSNTSVYVTFTGLPGFVLPIGFTVSDGSHQYTVQDGGIIGSSGNSAALYCLATTQGTWAVPVGTVTQVITSVPTGFTVTCTNITDGLPGQAVQTLQDYQAQVISAGQAIAQGTPTFLRAVLGRISGVQTRLVAIQVAGQYLTVICGGGDPYAVAYGIYQSIFNLPFLIGSELIATNITNANPGVVTTNLNHGYATGQVIAITNAIPGTFNGNYTITVIDQTSFSLGVDTTAFGAYTGNGLISPNLRNVTVSIYDFPDEYQITYVNPPLQTVGMAVTWNTIATNFIAPSSVSQLAAPALAAYINSIYVGQPINVLELQSVFQLAVATVVPTPLLSRLIFSVTINGFVVAPDAGTGLIYGDAQSYFETTTSLINVVQG